ncbi:unnamed protein product [Adineta steineri]|uniref:Uncharacterized protein n=2 Tax=Adineta steineri TaxID=433720 RepID=A0A818MMP7_9BILA|nr:unnamed protein product [Adineta steineri]
MGACTSAARHHKKHHRQLHKRTPTKNPFVLDNKQASSSPLTVHSNQQSQRLHSSQTKINVQSSSSIEPILYKTETNSLIQFYSSNSNNNNSNRNSYMSSSSSSTSQAQSRIPVPKSRFPIYRPQSSSSTRSTRSKNVTTTVDTTITTGTSVPMSLTNRSSGSSSSQPRHGGIPRPIVSGSQQTPVSSFVARSRSISPLSTISANSSSSSLPTQHFTKTETISSRAKITNTSKSKIPPSSSRINKELTTATTATNRPRLNTPSRPSNSSALPTTSSFQLTKADIEAVRDYYKAPKRMSFFTRRPLNTSSLKPSSLDTPIILEEKNEQSSLDEQQIDVPIDSQHDHFTTEFVQHGDSAYASTESQSNIPSSVLRSQANRQRNRTPSILSSSSVLSNVLNQDGLIDDDNCSLKSDDLICDYDDTLTLDSATKTSRTDSSSSNSLSLDSNKKSPMISSSMTTKTNISSNDHRSGTPAKSPTSDKSSGNLRESLDELTRLSSRMENIIDNEHHKRLLTRSVSLKPPPTSLPPREDAEQITMDIESYRQVMKDVMVVKTILHQLDRLLKHSDGANMTDSMIGSFHESMIGSRHHSLSGGGDINLRNNSIDENSSYDDLARELMILRKEREQDKQTIKLLQEQMYKYSSQANVQ